MIVTTFPWHWVGILGMPRRMSHFDYADAALQRDALPVAMSALGAFILLASGLLFLIILLRGQLAAAAAPEPYRFSVPLHPPRALAPALNGHAVWLALMIGLTVTNYGFPIAELAFRSDTSVPPVFVGAGR